MDWEIYSTRSYDANTFFEFYSEGVNGKIKKIVEYKEIIDGLVNVAFGDCDEITGMLIDNSRSNNGDRDKVLATVAKTASVFLETYPHDTLYIEGSSAGRTRLYQMAISKNLQKIIQQFTILGDCDGNWEEFQKGKNYKSIIVRKKHFL